MNKIPLAAAGGVVVLALFTPVMLKEANQAFVELIAVEEDPVSVLFVGDIMLDRSVARFARAGGSDALFAGVKQVFAEHDLVVGNLEGSITSNPSVSEVDNTILRFTFDPSLAEALFEAGIGVVSLANNHALDFGEFGFDDTKHYLSEAGVGYFGSPFNDPFPFITEIQNKTLCFVGYHELYRRDPGSVVEKIIEIELVCDETVVVAHWGVEYEHTPSSSQQELAHLFVDSGADLVIGAHPHVVQPVELYNNVAIFYSLGNFIFDQGWKGEVKRGAMVSVLFGEKETQFTVTPVNTYLQATLADEAVSAAVLADLGLASPTFALKN